MESSLRTHPKKKNRVHLFCTRGIPPPLSVQSRFHENRRRGHEEASWRWQQLEITWHIIGKHIRVTGSRPVSFLPDSSSAFDKHRPREEYPLWFATFTRLFTNGLVTRRSAPPPHPTPRPTLSLPGAKRSPPPPPLRNSSWRKWTRWNRAEAKPSRRFARHRAPGGFPSSNRRSPFCSVLSAAYRVAPSNSISFWSFHRDC